jgi:hypothetical protein|tara:strand:+ start:81 stop:512 length:432 start_codon:yes stop_codon:yes gene_type:complete
MATGKKKTNAKLMPFVNGKSIDWFYGWKGIEKLTNAYGKSWVDVGELIEDTWGDRADINQVVACGYIYLGLRQIKKRKNLKIKRLPKETDIHYAIRIHRNNINKWYKSDAQDYYKAMRQLYERLMKTRAKFVISSAKHNIKDI